MTFQNIWGDKPGMWHKCLECGEEVEGLQGMMNHVCDEAKVKVEVKSEIRTKLEALPVEVWEKEVRPPVEVLDSKEFKKRYVELKEVKISAKYDKCELANLDGLVCCNCGADGKKYSVLDVLYFDKKTKIMVCSRKCGQEILDKYGCTITFPDGSKYNIDRGTIKLIE